MHRNKSLYTSAAYFALNKLGNCVEYLLLENPKLELVIPKTPYIVPYRVRQSKIEIARVYHTSRRWPDRL